MKNGAFIIALTRRYRLEPGDGTRYEFSLTNMGENGVEGVISGVGKTGADYIWPRCNNGAM